MFFEPHHKKPVTHYAFLRRMGRSGGLALMLTLAWLAVGIVGFRACEDSSWIDSLFNASMIMSGMGPPQVPVSAATRIFASVYAILSGLVFLTVSAILLAPVVHRFMHLFHAEK
jgi:hypothetical protein